MVTVETKFDMVPRALVGNKPTSLARRSIDDLSTDASSDKSTATNTTKSTSTEPSRPSSFGTSITEPAKSTRSESSGSSTISRTTSPAVGKPRQLDKNWRAELAQNSVRRSVVAGRRSILRGKFGSHKFKKVEGKGSCLHESPKAIEKIEGSSGEISKSCVSEQETKIEYGGLGSDEPIPGTRSPSGCFSKKETSPESPDEEERDNVWERMRIRQAMLHKIAAAKMASMLRREQVSIEEATKLLQSYSEDEDSEDGGVPIGNVRTLYQELAGALERERAKFCEAEIREIGEEFFK